MKHLLVFVVIPEKEESDSSQFGSRKGSRDELSQDSPRIRDNTSTTTTSRSSGSGERRTFRKQRSFFQRGQQNRKGGQPEEVQISRRDEDP